MKERMNGIAATDLFFNAWLLLLVVVEWGVQTGQRVVAKLEYLGRGYNAI